MGEIVGEECKEGEKEEKEEGRMWRRRKNDNEI